MGFVFSKGRHITGSDTKTIAGITTWIGVGGGMDAGGFGA